MSQTGLSTLVLVFIAYALNMNINIDIEVFYKDNNSADKCCVANTLFSIFIIVFMKDLLYFLKI